jgi:hypothetical protein
MSTAKFEKLIDLVLNEDQERADQLFHEIIVEKSREIYESLMDEEQIDEDMTSGLLDEIEMEEEGMDGMMEDGDEFIDDEEIDGDFDTDGDLEMGAEDDLEAGEEDFDDMEADAEDMEGDEADLEDRVVDLEDKLDELMAEFEAQMGAHEEEEGEEEEEEGEEEEEESGLMESELTIKVKTPTHGDNGSNSKSVVSKGPKVPGNGAAPVKFSSSDESVPTSPKGPKNAYSKGEGQVKDAGKWENAAGKNANTADGKGEKTPAPAKTDGATNKKSVVANESRRFTKRRI